MTPNQIKTLKVFHILFASFWTSCVLVITALSFLAPKFKTGDEVYAFNVIYHFIDLGLLTPAAVLTFLTGLVYSLFTPWGFFKHRWIVVKWLITLSLIIIGTFYLGPMVEELLVIADQQRAQALINASYITGQKIGLYAGILNSALLIFAVFISTFKPWRTNDRK